MKPIKPISLHNPLKNINVMAIKYLIHQLFLYEEPSNNIFSPSPLVRRTLVVGHERSLMNPPRKWSAMCIDKHV